MERKSKIDLNQPISNRKSKTYLSIIDADYANGPNRKINEARPQELVDKLNNFFVNIDSIYTQREYASKYFQFVTTIRSTCLRYLKAVLLIQLERSKTLNLRDGIPIHSVKPCASLYTKPLAHVMNRSFIEGVLRLMTWLTLEVCPKPSQSYVQAELFQFSNFQ
ncbi:hypothetical protein WA026_003179 [Henosepilachna vigintioctopunctata]|uniref:Uncharacterized protein n=1 Tax=Henosepilachna vigintioctopunctata TaxID=420089 RepID=A0AAW1TMD7_9CUCU